MTRMKIATSAFGLLAITNVLKDPSASYLGHKLEVTVVPSRYLRLYSE